MSSGPGGDEKLSRDFAADADLAELAGKGEACPDPDRLWAAAALESPPAERRAVIDHTSRCAACAEDFRIVAAMVRLAPAASSREKAPAPAGAKVLTGPWGMRPAQRRFFGAIAALLLLGLMVAGLLDRLGRGQEPEVYRGGEETAIVSLLGETPTLSRGAALLRWQGPPGALYSLSVTGPDLRLVAEAHDLEKSSFRLRREDLAALPTGTRLGWRVEAVLTDGRRIASATFYFSLVE